MFWLNTPIILETQQLEKWDQKEVLKRPMALNRSLIATGAGSQALDEKIVAKRRGCKCVRMQANVYFEERIP